LRWFPVIMFLVWFWALVLAVWAAEVARMFAKRIGNAARRPLTDYQPRVAVILPVKGLDDDVLTSVQSLLHQDYPDHRLLCAVESAADPVCGVLEKLARQGAPGRLEIVVAGMATTRGQKIHNQLAAVARTTPTDEVLVFVDADAQTSPDWLRALVGPLKNAPVGAATGYRYYVPVGGHPANAAVSVINGTVAALLGPTRRNLAWGGSMAILRSNFFAFGIDAAWQHALSDDYVLSHCVKQQFGRNIEYVPRCLLASPADFNWRSFFTFAWRQYRITRICIFWAWLMASGGGILYLTGLIYPPVYWAIKRTHGENDYPLLIMFLTLYLLTIARGSCMLLGAGRALPQHAPALRRAWFWYTLGFPLVVLLNLVALLGATFGRKIVWRGVAYTMHSLTKTDVHRAAEAGAKPEPAPCGAK